jgi:hypothetical protein
MTAAVLERQEVVGAARLGFGRARDTAEGRARIAAAIARYVEYCRYTGTPFPYHQDNDSLEVEVEPVWSAS